MAASLQIVSGGPLDVNTYVLGAENGGECLLIDPGAEFESVREAVGGRRVTAVLLTHAHYDHMLHAEPWLKAGARLYVHELDAPGLRDPYRNLSTYMDEFVVLPEAEEVLLREGDVVDEAGVRLTVLHTPGHSRGSVSYLTEGVLFSGDTMFYSSYGRVDFPGGSMADMTRSLQRLGELPPETMVYPGHGPKTKIAWERGRFV